MSSLVIARVARARLFNTNASGLRRVSAMRTPLAARFSTASRLQNEHGEESFEEFTARYEKEFEQVQDVFELQRNLNNAFAYDLVPSPSVITAALRAARRVNDFPTAVRIFEGIKAKVENQNQYDEYIKELQPIREELGVNLKEVMYPESS
ncbi:cytochrome c oxidase subunit VA-domain-containing protein [Neohortaea acidophila]|uniref:Cytochrome c oxidase subunit 6, mitochondrial n=1 Tax=Neohortaea acidophila TaxID=245834 RepID=A0A6A6PTR5_9PEZI|nr:cytochrome c oxidase subunit VA-domain-containing protein [Neohortaea acidophila]KAF2483382.1 cytochrome c oxidase subunit VA-domain-containing protein [Neohortaea acidophila]